MATADIREIQRWMADNGQTDALPSSGRMFVEIRFDAEGDPGVVDDEFADRVLTVDTSIGLATVVFDSFGRLRSIDIS